MTLQAKILPWSLCGPSHIPPLLLSSSKGLREKKVDFDGCFVSWDVFALERRHHTVPFPPYSTSVHKYNCKHCKVQQDLYQDLERITCGPVRFFAVLSALVFLEEKS
jgi:hypothetical protein